ncbi:10437_t:CDS:2 [Funneliformis geosporum]|nr:10437_t:CDS:2 [Funneliformis geosporum]
MSKECLSNVLYGLSLKYQLIESLVGKLTLDLREDPNDRTVRSNKSFTPIFSYDA